MRSGEFALSRLGTALVEFFIEEEVLTRDSLTLLAKTLMASIAEVLQAARRASSPEEWRDSVVGPLRITVSDLVSGIERRQRGLDIQQEEFQKRIAELLETDWFGAVGQCQELLDSTAKTLRELNEILLRDTHQLQTLLQNVQELAIDAHVVEAEGVAHRVMDQIDRIASWGAARQRAWSEYYEYVHRYLRDVVRLDPSRALTERLREQLSRHKQQPFALTVASAAAIRLLRPVEPASPPPPVRRPRKEREHPVEEPEREPDPRLVLEAQVQALVDAGLSELSEITARIAQDVPAEKRFVMAGRVAEVVASLARPLATTSRPWVPVDEDFTIEQWQMPKVKRD
jgi:chromosome partition protein MukF